MADFPYMEGVLDGTGVATINCGGKSAPINAVLKSSLATRKIEFSPTSGEFFVPQYDANTATMCCAVSLGGIFMIRFTGSPGDSWNVR